MRIFIMKNKTFHKRKILVVFAGAFAMIFVLIGRLTYLTVSYTHLTLPTNSRV